jgi:RNA polymerase sigma-70 factor, ECF subfamily
MSTYVAAWSARSDAALMRVLDSLIARANLPAIYHQAFLVHLNRVVSSQAELVEVVAGFEAADFGIAVRALEGDAIAQTQIATVHLSRIPGWIARSHPNPTFADDVVQEVSSLLFAPKEGAASRLLGYSGRGPLGAFLRTVAIRTAQNMVRGKREVQDDQERDQAAPSARSPEVALAAAQGVKSFTDMLRDAVIALSSSDRNLLRLHYVEGLTLEQVASHLKISRATAARHLARARTLVLERANALHAQQAGPVTRSQGGSIDVPAELALTLSSLFRTDVKK